MGEELDGITSAGLCCPSAMCGADAGWSAARAKAAHSLGPHQHRPGPGGALRLTLQCHLVHKKTMSNRHMQSDGMVMLKGIGEEERVLLSCRHLM